MCTYEFFSMAMPNGGGGDIPCWGCERTEKTKQPWAKNWWLTPVILAAQEASIRRITVQSQFQANSL
jgi:hypothetical protein